MNGTFETVLCPDGSANPGAQEQLTKLAPRTMGLDAAATVGQISAAICADLPGGTIPTVVQAYEFARAEHGWTADYPSVAQVDEAIVNGKICAASSGSGGAVSSFRLPDLRGATQTGVKDWIRKNRLKIHVFYTTAPGSDYSVACRMAGDGVVISQRPSRGSRVTNLASTTLWLSIAC